MDLKHPLQPAFSLVSANPSHTYPESCCHWNSIASAPSAPYCSIMGARHTFQLIRKATCSIMASLRILVIVLGITLSPLGISFSTCLCAACECSELESGCCCDNSPPSSCCSSDGCRITCDDEENHSSCECHPCQCDLEIAVAPVSMPWIVDAAEPVSIAPPEFSELIPTVQSSLILSLIHI